MKYTLSLLFALLVLLTKLQAEDIVAERAQVLALGQLTAPPAMQPATGYTNEAGLKAIYYDALPWQGKPTKVFAWLGLPANRTGKVPGVVLVHGGGGTAFKEWVQKWNDRGYAAISIAVEGQTDRRVPKGATHANHMIWERVAEAGPARDGIYGDTAAPLTNQWMYHAVADTVLANSLLRSLPEVDADKVGVMGISWGGVITSTVMGLDSRFAFAIPVYGCGHLYDEDNEYGRALVHNEIYREVWDPMVWLDRARMPAFWFTDLEDQAFALDCQAACYQAAPGPHMAAIVPGMKHGHAPAWNSSESYAFAESIVQTGKSWCVSTNLKAESGTASCEFTSTKPLDHALLVSTTDTGYAGDRKWIQSPATLEQHGGTWHVTAELPAGTTAWFLNAHSGKLTVSSDFQECK